MNYENVFKALSDFNRLKIYKLLKKGPLCACELLKNLKITQPTLSHHMKTLVESNLVTINKRGVWNIYSLNIKTINMINDFLKIK